MTLNSGPRPRAQTWSRTIYEAYPDIQGLLYPSSMHASREAVALYDRSEIAMPDAAGIQFHRSLDDRALLPLLDQASAELGYRVV